MKVVRILVIILECLSISQSMSIAYAIEDNQQELRRQEQQRELERQLKPNPEIHLHAPEIQGVDVLIPKDESPAFLINNITLQGELAKKFTWALKSARYAGKQYDTPIGRRLGSKGIMLIAKRVQNAIIQRGFITTTIVVQPQNLASGTLKLTVIVGKISKIEFSSASNKYAKYWNAIPVKPGDVLNLRDLEQALENFKRLQTVTATFAISPGSSPGTSAITITWKQKCPIRLNARLDDSGSKQNGKYQGNATLFLETISGLNDLFYINVRRNCSTASLGQRGNYGYGLYYTIPYGYWLLEINHNHDQSHFPLHNNQLKSNLYHSGSNFTDLKLSRVIYRDCSHKTKLNFKGFMRHSNARYAEIDIEMQKVKLTGGAIELNHRHTIGNATLDCNLGYQNGIDAFGAVEPAEGTKYFKIITAEALLNTRFNCFKQACSYTSNLQYQHSFTKLAPAQQFSIGSRHSVRGFSGNIFPLSAPGGCTWRNEIGFQLGLIGAQLYAGLDYGLLIGKENIYHTRWLAGSALGLRGSWYNLNYDLFLAIPLRHDARLPNSKLTGGFSLSFNLF